MDTHSAGHKCSAARMRMKGKVQDVVKYGEGGTADIKETFVHASPSSCMRIRAREQWTLRTLRRGN